MRAQGLPLTTIVVAVLALILLVFIFIIIFNIGGLGDLFKNLVNGTTGGATLASFQQECEFLCVQAMNFDPCAATAPQFCTVVKDTSQDGGLVNDYCWDNAGAYKQCTVNDRFGDSHILIASGCALLPYAPTHPRCQ
jgi:hypothetical protein